MRTVAIFVLLLLVLSACGGPTVTAEGASPVEPPATPPVSPTVTTVEAPTSTPVPSSPAAAVVGLRLVAEGLTAPVALSVADDGSERLFITDQIGLIWVVDRDGNRLEEPFLDLREQVVPLRGGGYDERGLLGLAFHPDYAENGRFFVYYSAPLREGAPAAWDHTNRLSEFTVAGDNPDWTDPATERVIMEIDQPQTNHNAGSITFGPDGYLYIPLGDGGGGGDDEEGHVEDWYEVNAGGNGQDIEENLLGSILRIDVDNIAGDRLYAVPADNPFVGGTSGLDEIWAYGFRNPYRIAFDPGGEGELFVGDAGQELWEEIDIATAGGNYGWNVKEGLHCFSTERPEESLDECPDQGEDGASLIDPIIEFATAEQPGGLGLVVIGGAVYRGTALAGWDGNYVFGVWSRTHEESRGALFVATRPGGGSGRWWEFVPIEIAERENGELGEYLRSFGQDLQGELYILTSSEAGPEGETGKVYQLTALQP